MNAVLIQDVMSTGLCTATTEDTLARVKELFDEHQIHHIPVIDADRHVVGILSKTDLDRLSWGMTLFKNPDREVLNDALYHTKRVKDVMTKQVETLEASDPIDRAYWLFRTHDFRAIPILKSDVLVGIVSPIDLVKPFIHQKI